MFSRPKKSAFLLTLQLSLLSLLLLSEQSFAGILGHLGVQWKTHSFQPLDAESTPNYYGIGPYGAFGYSLWNKWDMALFASYSPAKMKDAEVGKEHAQFVYYGLETGVRIAGSIYFGLKAGGTGYHLIRQKDPIEVGGRWGGFGASLVMGGVVSSRSKSGLQVTLNMGSSSVTEEESDEARRFDWVGLSVGYVDLDLDLGFKKSFLSGWF